MFKFSLFNRFKSKPKTQGTRKLTFDKKDTQETLHPSHARHTYRSYVSSIHANEFKKRTLPSERDNLKSRE